MYQKMAGDTSSQNIQNKSLNSDCEDGEEFEEITEEEDNNYLVTLNPEPLIINNDHISITNQMMPTLMNKENGTLSTNTIGLHK